MVIMRKVIKHALFEVQSAALRTRQWPTFSDWQVDITLEEIDKRFSGLKNNFLLTVPWPLT